ncbi:hypothetical protein RchiOBHm_Chr3g0461991 [Rosa chinensis]|uniref:Uncharacterized protein n=1 Tax=Rosa chinensis TaxID=74649 RepID=A0A2P6R8S2_ROSCH|nr:hypothetical protein RchiOBHm_Chr3g0461991 [Rosa chinensis]
MVWWQTKIKDMGSGLVSERDREVAAASDVMNGAVAAASDVMSDRGIAAAAVGFGRRCCCWNGTELLLLQVIHQLVRHHCRPSLLASSTTHINIVNNALENSSGLSWEPLVMWRAFRQVNNTKHEKDVEVQAIDCLDWCFIDVNMHKFFTGYSEGMFDTKDCPRILKLKDWPPSTDFDKRLPRHGKEFVCCLPLKEYTHPTGSILNLDCHLPKRAVKPDLGPKTYIAYGGCSGIWTQRLWRRQGFD